MCPHPHPDTPEGELLQADDDETVDDVTCTHCKTLYKHGLRADQGGSTDLDPDQAAKETHEV